MSVRSGQLLGFHEIKIKFLVLVITCLAIKTYVQPVYKMFIKARFSSWKLCRVVKIYLEGR